MYDIYPLRIIFCNGSGLLCQKKRRIDVLSGFASGFSGVDTSLDGGSCTDGEWLLPGTQRCSDVLSSPNKTQTHRPTRT